MATKTRRPADPTKRRASTGLSVAVRLSKNPVLMTEDEGRPLRGPPADKATAIGFEEYLAKHGYELDPQGRPRRASIVDFYRMIYYVSTQQHRVIVVRIRKRDHRTYGGF